jgi:hypothetical protein
MPLPAIATPKYPIEIPSSKVKTTFRPFLVKEQKILHMALESQDTKQMLLAMSTIIENCVDGIKNVESMPMFDVEYIFLKIRSKSVGESIELKIPCTECKKRNEVVLNLDTVEVVFPEGISNKIMLNDKLGIILRYPALKDSNLNLSDHDISNVLDFICDSVEMVFDETTTYGRKDFTDDEIRKFVESLSTSQFEKIINFYANIPQLNKQMNHVCSACGKDISLDFRGLSDFFT